MLEVIRGEQAYTMLKEADEFNNPPPSEGMEYIAAKVRLRYIGTEDEAVSFEKLTDLATIGDKGDLYTAPTTYDPQPELRVTLYPGGEYEGWISMLAGVGETGVKLIFDPNSDASGENRRFLALE